MPAYSSTGAAPFKLAARNQNARWTPERLVGDVFYPALSPSFGFELSDPIFATGSCFAQEIQMALAHHGARNLITFPEDLPERLFMQHMSETEQNFWPLHFFHRFNVPAIMQEFGRLVDPGHALNGDALIVEDAKGLFRDYHYSDQFPLRTMEECIERRALIRNKFLQLRNARLVVMTLGLLEAWRDKKHDLFLNVTPSYAMATEPNRYEFVIMNQAEVRMALSEIVHLLKAFAPDARVVITVSPIPLDVTFAPQDVVVSTSHSKATLLSAAREVIYEHPHADYFPSYEMTALSKRSEAWAQDQRHVRPEFVSKIMSHFIQGYVK